VYSSTGETSRVPYSGGVASIPARTAFSKAGQGQYAFFLLKLLLNHEALCAGERWPAVQVSEVRPSSSGRVASAEDGGQDLALLRYTVKGPSLR